MYQCEIMKDSGPSVQVRINRGLVKKIEKFIDVSEEYKTPSEFLNEGGRIHLARKLLEQKNLIIREENNFEIE